MAFPKSFIPDNAPTTSPVQAALPKSFVPDAKPQEQGLLSKLGGRVNQVATGISNTVKNIPEDVAAITDPLGNHKESIGTDLLHTSAGLFGAAKDVAGAAVSGVNSLARKIPGVADLEDKAIQGINNSTGVYHDVKTGIDKAKNSTYGKQLSNDPEFSGAVNDATDLAGGVGAVTGAASIYGHIKNSLANHNLVNMLHQSGVDNPEQVFKDLSDHGITPGQVTYKQGIKILRDSIQEAKNTAAELASHADSTSAAADPMAYFPSTPGFENVSAGAASLQGHISNLENALQALEQNGQEIFGPALKSVASAGGHLTLPKFVGGLLGADALKAGGQFLYNKFVGQSPWSK